MSEIIRDGNYKIIGRIDGNIVQDGNGKIVGRYDEGSDVTRDASGNIIARGDQRYLLIGR
jgi:hypothetical protein